MNGEGNTVKNVFRHDGKIGWRLCFSILFAAILVGGCKTGPPRESGAFRDAELVELIRLDPGIRLDIRYATTNNFMHRRMYKQPRAFLQRPAAEALARVNCALHAKGYGLLVFDAYRPWAVTKMFWDNASDAERKIEFVANPKKGSRHNRGCAVDLSLFDLQTGQLVTMPSDYDEFSERAFPNYGGGPPEARALRDLLRAAMEAEGFAVYLSEWWHFDYRDWRQYRILNVTFERIGE
jgi:zinc D-Ala-D-Ala dipeptidase